MENEKKEEMRKENMTKCVILCKTLESIPVTTITAPQYGGSILYAYEYGFYK